MSEFLSIAIGALMPMLISWLKNSRWSARTRVLFTLAACLLAGVLNVAALGQLDVNDIAASFALIFTSATAMYKLWFETTPLNRDLESKDVL